MIHLSEAFAFLNKARIKLPLEHLSENSPAMIDAYDSEYRDHDYWNLSLMFNEVQAPLENARCKTVGVKKISHNPNANTDNFEPINK
jgi:hypothetical protein